MSNSSNNIDLILDYLTTSSAITLLVLSVLSIYLIIILSLFIYRFILLKSQTIKESASLNSLIRGETTEALPSTFLSGCTIDNDISAEILNACYISVNKDITKGMTFLSIVASTAPFIGLFGTVVSILESFTQFSGSSKVSFSVIAPVISEALVATAAGIFVAIFAYTFHQILNRKAYELSTIIKSASDIILSRNK